MSFMRELTRVNNGLRANDGTGDTLRQGATQIGSNFDVVADTINRLAASQGSGVQPFKTKADLEAAIAAGLVPANSVLVVFMDPTPANNTSYVWDGVGPLSTAYDRLTYALGYGSGFQADVPGGVLRSYNNKVQETKSLLDFAGDGAVYDWAPVLRLADAWLSERSGGRILVPVGLYPFYSDVRFNAVNAPVWEGQGAMSRLMGVNNARIIIGQAIPVAQGGGLPPLKTGIKTIQTTLLNLSIKPQDNHGTECLLLDFCDNFYGFRLDLGPFGNNGSAPSTGVKFNWTQYSEFYQCSINVNGIPVHVYLPRAEPENEDHYTFRNCWFYIGKTIGDYRPGIITVEREVGRSAGIFHFNIDTCHLGKFVSEGPTHDNPVDGVVVVNQDPEGSYVRTFHSLLISSTLFEGVEYPVNLHTRAKASDTSLVAINACSFLVFKTALWGADVSKCSASITGSYFQEGTTISDGVRCSFVGFNRQLSVDNPFPQGLSVHRWMSKSGLDLSGGASTVMRQAGETNPPDGATYFDIPHQLAAAPDTFSIAPGWNTTWWVDPAGTDGNKVTVKFGSPCPGGARLRWDLEIRDN